ncbi:BZ3500_MvSof-1268-A1-R1_Chr8-1g09769 [Microbotryum saponariae]|uniref:BZ3500_MvSof-1268-A1-R1_Chr8-1g09769 protein n=1 Tax=Microbotryum saponariae TaxID=289078 RepID=A0A2X0MFF5_9BASI|nr:BZ3500_MvSof-1268-A1-R1_Chr8-1g09769 [Microbotryum saponariae]SDA08055.1 BZ3501_MvSof-1269-A2-R1_Chr8-1g09492 [Microbotryum saponariae]
MRRVLNAEILDNLLHLHGAVADGYRSLVVGDHRLPLDYERVWAELDVVERIQERFRWSLAWLDKLKGNAREVLTDVLRTAVWDARMAPEDGPSLETLVSFLSDDWLGKYVNYTIADIIQLARSKPELLSRLYKLIPSDCFDNGDPSIRYGNDPGQVLPRGLAGADLGMAVRDPRGTPSKHDQASRDNLVSSDL